MDNIALAVFSVGLCFYIAYRKSETGESDCVASFMAFIAGLALLLRILL